MNRALEFDYQQTYKLMRKFRNFSKDEANIVDYLMQLDAFEGTYSDFTRAIGAKDSCMTNIRKSLLKLSDMGIVHIVHKYCDEERKGKRSNPMKACYIMDGWLDTFLNED